MKACMTCRHSMFNHYAMERVCWRLKSFHPVHGNVAGLCSDLREVGGRCGPNGLWLEERVSALKNLRDCLVESFRDWFGRGDCRKLS